MCVGVGFWVVVKLDVRCRIYFQQYKKKKEESIGGNININSDDRSGFLEQ